MEALILSCSTGGGHNSAAHAIEKELKNRGWKTTFFDPYTLRSQAMANRVGGAYVSLVRHTPELFGLVYAIGQGYEAGERAFGWFNPVLAVQRKTALALKAYLDTHPMDLILCTHPYPALMITWLKARGHVLPPSIMIATDYTCIPFEADIRTDWMVVPARELVRTFNEHGVELSRILPLGIPVDPAFTHPKDKAKAAKDLGLDPDCRYILVGGGSMGVDFIWDVLSRIRPILQDQPDLRVLVLCGSNQGLYKKIAALKQASVQPLPFTDRMPDYLSLASLYITKPGGLSITEAAACRTPLLLMQAIPGCETANAHFFEKMRLAKYATDYNQLLPFTRELLSREYRANREMQQFIDGNTSRLADWCLCAALLNPRPGRDDFVKDSVISIDESTIL